MSDKTPDIVGEPTVEPQVEPQVERRTKWKRRFVARWSRRALALVVAGVAAVTVSLATIDLGRFPLLRTLAEQQGSSYLKRPLHIGGISARLAPGRFVLTDVVIEGKRPGDRPFMSAKRIDVGVPWWTVFSRQLHVNVTLDDWAMVVESWPNGEHNLPKLMPESRGERRTPFTTTVDFAYARHGHFIYDDHATPWSVVAPNLEFSLVRATSLREYVGTVSFAGGTVRIQGYEPMTTAMSTRFVLDGPRVALRHIDLRTDGTESHINGQVDFSTRPTPTQTYNVNASIQFAQMKDIFFARETWRLGGEGEFTGVFKMFPGGRDLTGTFNAERAEVNDLGFDHLHGSLTWTPTLFAVTHADTDLLGGHSRFDYSLAPLGTPTGATATFQADYAGVDLFDLDRLMSLRGLRLTGLASGRLELQWRNGKFGTTRAGVGWTAVTEPDGVTLASPILPASPIPAALEPRPFDALRLTAPISLGGNVSYHIDPQGMTFDDSWVATTHSYIAFKGRMAREGASAFPFHVTSHDWQESDRLLAAIMTAVAGPTRAIEVGGRGTFDGEMTGALTSPRITGRFAGDAMRVWDVTWGRAAAELAIEGGYVEISNSRVGDRPDVFITTEGRYALGYRKDGAEEIRSRVRMTNWPIADLRHAFLLDDWPMDGTMGAADLQLSGKYRDMFGSGTLRIDRGIAWDEPFESATGVVELEGTGMRVNRIEMAKSTGLVHGAARIGWDGTYAFNADGEGVPVESLALFKAEGLPPLTGQLRFTVSGAGGFEEPRYTFDAAIDDLFVGDEGIGSVTGRASIIDEVMTVERLVATSGRLQVLGTGTIGFDDAYTSDIRLRFTETALDPYLKFILTDDLSPYTRIVVDGSLEVKGPLATPALLVGSATIDRANLTLFDYALTNDGPVELRVSRGVLDIGALALRGTDTNVRLSGGANTNDRSLQLSAAGESNLAILQLLPQFAGITASGTASIDARLTGTFDVPRFGGEATIQNGRLRPVASPHSLQAINGRIELGEDAINMRGVTGRIGDGDVTFGGTIELDRFDIAEYNLTAVGRSMRLRYPEGFTSTVNMDLALVGPKTAPRLSGTIDVLRAALAVDTSSTTGLLGLAGGGGAALAPGARTVPMPAADATPIAMDIQVTAPRMTFVNLEEIRLEGQADLSVRGTYDEPSMTGAIDVLGGEIIFNGNRYVVRESEISFRNEQVLEPYLSLVADARTRVAGEDYTINVTASGTFQQMTLQVSTDPWLPQSDVYSLVLGAAPQARSAEQRALRSSEQLQEQFLQSAGAVLITSPLTSLIGSAVQRTGVVDTVQLTPLLSGAQAFQRLDPGARVTLSRRISPRLTLIYSRTVGSLEEEIILLEYDQNDQLSWVLSRNEDRTFAIDFRKLFSFR